MNTEQQAKLLEEIAAVMRERPEDWWREFDGECPHRGWLPIRAPNEVWGLMEDGVLVRRRPRTITIAGIEVPEPMREAPPVGTRYFVTNPGGYVFATANDWEDDAADHHLLSRGLCHRTMEAAGQHARALILASGGEVE